MNKTRNRRTDKRNVKSLIKKNTIDGDSIFTKDQLTDLIHQRRVDKVFASIKTKGKKEEK